MEACKDGGGVETEPKWAELADVNPDYMLFHFFVSTYKLSVNYPSFLTTVQGSKDKNDEDAPFPNNRTVCISGQSS